MATGLTGGEMVVNTLAAEGVDLIFGIPGVHTLALYDALRTSPIRHVLARHEQGAGFMADGYARATGRPGVAFVISGPGVTNIATALGQAYTDGSSVLVVSSNVARPYTGGAHGCLHDLKDQLGVTAAVTDWNARVERVADTPAIVREALRRLRTGRGLPVHIELPTDVLEATDEPADAAILAPERRQLDAGAIQRAAEMLAAAKRPAIFCGGGAARAGAGAAILAIAERLNAPVLTSALGKGTVPDDHPLSLGALWQPGNAVDDLAREADCLLVVGSRLGFDTTAGFRFPFPPHVIRIDIDEAELARHCPERLAIAADAQTGAQALLTMLEATASTPAGFDRALVQNARRAAEAAAWHAERRPWVDALRRAIPRDGIVVFDMTQMASVSCALYPAYAPGTFLFPFGFGTLGFSLPAAIGAKLGRPELPVVSVVGDGGFQFSMAEFATAVQYGVSLPIVLFNDSTFSAVKEAQKDFQGGRYSEVDLINPDFRALARAYGAHAELAETPDALTAAIQTALDRPGPTLIEVPTSQWV
ncbi:MAG: thiamine pyrophosphate-binding protein [Thermomicrobiales bacterium]|nr:thiamine pyrophosphate-binding protein [Thermomicrobiales bacterium]